MNRTVNKTLKDMWYYLTEEGIATETELQLITVINGYNEKTLCRD